MTIVEYKDPSDLLICGSCRRDFPLSNIVNFVDHKKFNCSEFDSARDLLGCLSCPSTFGTPWSLLQHAQIVHDMKIYQEQRALDVERGFPIAEGSSDDSVSAETDYEATVVNLPVENFSRHAADADSARQNFEFCNSDPGRNRALNSKSIASVLVGQENRNKPTVRLNTTICKPNLMTQFTRHANTVQAPSKGKNHTRLDELSLPGASDILYRDTNVPLHKQPIPIRLESTIAHSLPFSRETERDYSSLQDTTGDNGVYYTNQSDNSLVHTSTDSVIHSKTGAGVLVQTGTSPLQHFKTITPATSSTVQLEQSLGYQQSFATSAAGILTEPLLISRNDRNTKEFRAVSSAITIHTSVSSTLASSSDHTALTSPHKAVNTSLTQVENKIIDNLAFANNSVPCVRGKSENLLVARSDRNLSRPNVPLDLLATTSLIAECNKYGGPLVEHDIGSGVTHVKEEGREMSEYESESSVGLASVEATAALHSRTVEEGVTAGSNTEEIDLPPGVDDVSDITVDAIAAEITEKVKCTDRACGTTPHTHRRLKRCCSAVIPKKRKHHIETKHRIVLAGSGSKFSSPMTLLKYSSGTSSAATAGARSRRRGNAGNSSDDGHTNIYIDVDDDCAVTLGPEIAESLSNESVGSTGYRKQRSVIIEPGMTLSIPVSYSGRSAKGMATVHPKSSRSSADNDESWLLSSSHPSTLSTTLLGDGNSLSDSPTQMSAMGLRVFEGSFRKSCAALADEHSTDGSSITVAFSQPDFSGTEMRSDGTHRRSGGETSNVYSIKKAESYHSSGMPGTAASTSAAVVTSDWEGGAVEQAEGKLSYDWGGAGESSAGSDGVMMIGSDCNQKRRKYPTSRPFKCGECSDAFNQRIHLRKHQSKHTGVKPYKCDKCDYATVERSHLKVHIRVHTGEKPYKCTVCEYATAQNSTLKIHLKRKHHLQSSPATAAVATAAVASAASATAAAVVAASVLNTDSQPSFDSSEGV